MQTSKLERILLTNVGYIAKKYTLKVFEKPFGFVSRGLNDFNFLYTDIDTWLLEDDDLKDSQLQLLGLDVGSINDDDRYWNYDYTRRGRGRYWAS